jgi:uncharacterized protein (DUF2345 family)
MHVVQDDDNKDEKGLGESRKSSIVVRDIEELQGTNITENDRIEFLTKAGTRVTITYARSSELEKILIISGNNNMLKQDKIIELDLKHDAISILANNNDLKIKARNIEIEATDTMKIKSKSTMTINGSTINLN